MIVILAMLGLKIFDLGKYYQITNCMKLYNAIVPNIYMFYYAVLNKLSVTKNAESYCFILKKYTHYL